MIDANLARLGDRELMKLFALSSTKSITKRAAQVIAELEQRGYLFDPNRRDFVTCEQWNALYHDAPKDCDRHARRLTAS